MIKPPIVRTNGLSLLTLVCVLAVGVAGCSSRLANRGNHVDPEKIAEITAGKQTREEVSEILGSPSSMTPFGSDTWYYISKRTETFAFFNPEVVARQVLIIKFGADKKVASVNVIGLEDGDDVQMVQRTTPTHGNEMTIIEQVVGNLGRFKKKQQQRKDGDSLPDANNNY